VQYTFSLKYVELLKQASGVVLYRLLMPQAGILKSQKCFEHDSAVNGNEFSSVKQEFDIFTITLAFLVHLTASEQFANKIDIES
jgi:hypothetical protein